MAEMRGQILKGAVKASSGSAKIEYERSQNGFSGHKVSQQSLGRWVHQQKPFAGHVAFGQAQRADPFAAAAVQAAAKQTQDGESVVSLGRRRLVQFNDFVAETEVRFASGPSRHFCRRQVEQKKLQTIAAVGPSAGISPPRKQTVAVIFQQLIPNKIGPRQVALWDGKQKGQEVARKAIADLGTEHSTGQPQVGETGSRAQGCSISGHH